MSLSEMISSILAHPQGASGAIYDDEVALGRLAFHPGDVSWFSADDWKAGSVASVDCGNERLIFLDALRPGTGAFTRLISAVRAAWLRPLVIEPTHEFAQSLSRNGWKRRSVGIGLHHEDVFRHPQDRQNT